MIAFPWVNVYNAPWNKPLQQQMKIEPQNTKRKLLYPLALLCAGLAGCDANARQHAPGIVPRDNPPPEEPKEAPQDKPTQEPPCPAQPQQPAQPEELPQILGGDVPYIPEEE